MRKLKEKQSNIKHFEICKEIPYGLHSSTQQSAYRHEEFEYLRSEFLQLKLIKLQKFTSSLYIKKRVKHKTNKRTI